MNKSENKSLVSLGTRFGYQLKEIRTQKGMSQERLANLAGLHRTQITLLETGQRLPKLDTILQLIQALDITPDTLLLPLTDIDSSCDHESVKEG